MTRFVCPHCQRAVLNRRLENCEFCDRALPAELLLTEEEKERPDRRDERRDAIERVAREAQRQPWKYRKPDHHAWMWTWFV